MMLNTLTLKQMSTGLKSKAFSSQELIKSCYQQIDQTEDQIGAWITLNKESALDIATQIDSKRMYGDVLDDLAGLPIGIKDNICTKGTITTCASKMLLDFDPGYDATVVTKLREIGMISLGKLNMDEFAMGSSTENSSIKLTRNPVNTDYVPGGSSGGSAAAVAAKHVPVALGSDTGGSIRQPAAFCGNVGLKPTYGTISRYGLIAFASSLDQIGPIAGTTEDVAMLMNALAFHDEKDSTSAKMIHPDYTSFLSEDVKGMRIALPKEYFEKGLSPDIKESILAAAKTYESMGAIVEEVSIKTVEYALPAYYLISSAEASSNLSRFDGIEYGYRSKNATDIEELYKMSRSEAFGKEVKRRILLGTYALSSGYYDAYYKKAQQARTIIRKEFSTLFKKYDFIISPTTPNTAWKFGEKSSDPLEMYLEDIYTVPVNIAGVPAVSLPCGKDSKGLPIGMQLIGNVFEESKIIRAAHAFEMKKKGV